jgi:hypothetical protein
MEKKTEPNVQNYNRNYLRDIVHVALKLTEYTQVPVLFLSNPGLGKTSMFRSWIEQNNYRLTTLIGSQRTAEEVLGYMVNDGGKLKTITPDWFDEIWENKKAGYKTALFLDELSQAREDTQGAMLQLCFDRRVGGRNNILPEDCLIVAAANYKENLPAQCALQAPTLNRFCLVNLESMDATQMIDEFLQSPEEMTENLPAFGCVEVTPKISEAFRTNLKEMLKSLVENYSNKNDPDCVVNIHNKSFNEIFDQPGKIYNFMSGRTISYLYRMGLGMIHLDLCKPRYEQTAVSIAYGLMGLATNTFRNPQDINDWEIALSRAFRKALRRTIEQNKDAIKQVTLNYQGLTISDSISKWMNYAESTSGSLGDTNLKNLVGVIKKSYSADESNMTKVISGLTDKAKSNTFLNDMQKINTLGSFLENIDLTSVQSMIADVNIIKAAYDGYVSMLLSNLLNGTN